MKLDTLTLLAEPDEIHDYVMSLWSDGPIGQSHKDGGLVWRIIERFARLPRIFFEPSNTHIEWTHFSPWWGAILLCDYENPAIRDLRYLHEIYHAATIPHVRGMNAETMAARNFLNEREASTFTEIAIYLEFPQLRETTFDHPIFADRIVFPSGDLTQPDPALQAMWHQDRGQVLQQLMFRRLQAVLAKPGEFDADDPQIVWLRRYSEQGAAWVQVWENDHRKVDNAMCDLRENTARLGRRDAADRYLAWLTSAEITGGGDVPFESNAARFRNTFDSLLEAYDRSMEAAKQQAVRHR